MQIAMRTVDARDYLLTRQRKGQVGKRNFEAKKSQSFACCSWRTNVKIQMYVVF